MKTPPPIPPGNRPNLSVSRTGGEPPAPVGRSSYNLIADTVGLVPNVRRKDNLYQGICVLVFLIIGSLLGWLRGGWPVGVLVGAFVGLVAGTLLSGLVIMVAGYFRKS